MAVPQSVSVSRAQVLQVLERTREICRPAFALISSDDARREGFFQRAKPEVDRFEALREVEREGGKTREGVRLKLEDSRDNFPWLDIYNERFSVKARIFFWTNECPNPESPLMPPFYPQIIHVDGISRLQELPADSLAHRSTEMCTWHMFPVAAHPGLLEGVFQRYESDVMPVQHSPFYNIPVSKDLARFLPVDPELVSKVFDEIVRLYPENNHELARIALNLLAEFEAMLASACAYLKVLSDTPAEVHARQMVESFSRWVVSRD